MKKVFLSLALIFCCTFGIFAQKAFVQSSRSYVNNDNKITYVSAPKTWFKQGTPEKKAEVRALQKKLNPYMTICFEDEEFYFLYLSMPVSKQDNAWGVYPTGQSIPEEMDPKQVAAGN